MLRQLVQGHGGMGTYVFLDRLVLGTKGQE